MAFFNVIQDKTDQEFVIIKLYSQKLEVETIIMFSSDVWWMNTEYVREDFLSADVCERPEDSWSDLHHPETVRHHPLRIWYPSDDIISVCVCVCVFQFLILTLSPHSHVYVLEKSQHKVPEEALKVSQCVCVNSVCVCVCVNSVWTVCVCVCEQCVFVCEQCVNSVCVNSVCVWTVCVCEQCVNSVCVCVNSVCVC